MSGGVCGRTRRKVHHDILGTQLLRPGVPSLAPPLRPVCRIVNPAPLRHPCACPALYVPESQSSRSEVCTCFWPDGESGGIHKIRARLRGALHDVYGSAAPRRARHEVRTHGRNDGRSLTQTGHLANLATQEVFCSAGCSGVARGGACSLHGDGDADASPSAPPSSSPLHTRSTVNFEKIGVEVGDEWGVVGAPRHKLAMPAAAGETGSACCREPRHRPQRCRRHVG
jgi:hypothetical protein